LGSPWTTQDIAPRYRSRRIGLPLLAFCLGTGEPAWVLQIYALLNFAFWLLLLVAILRSIGCKRSRDLLLAGALLWSTGTLISVARSLTDFPAAVLGVLAVFSNSKWIMAAVLLGASGLVKETSLLSFTALPLSKGPQRFDVKRFVISTLIIALPIALWHIYVNVRLPFGSATGARNFTFPILGIARKFCDGVGDLTRAWADASISQRRLLLFEVLCPLSLVIQAIYLIAKPRVISKAWRFGIGFVVLLSILGEAVWVEQNAYCRVLLPLTFSFNLLIHRHESGTKFATLYLIGNGGMCCVALQYLL